MSAGGDFVAFASDADNLGAVRPVTRRTTRGGLPPMLTNVFRRELPFVPTPAERPARPRVDDHTAAGHGGGGPHRHGGHTRRRATRRRGIPHGATAARRPQRAQLTSALMLGSLRPDDLRDRVRTTRSAAECGNDVISLGAGSDVGYGGDCGR